MNNPVRCDNCGSEMKLSKKFETKPRGKFQKKYRIRRFECELCGVQKTVFADGRGDEARARVPKTDKNE